MPKSKFGDLTSTWRTSHSQFNKNPDSPRFDVHDLTQDEFLRRRTEDKGTIPPCHTKTMAMLGCFFLWNRFCAQFLVKWLGHNRSARCLFGSNCGPCSAHFRWPTCRADGILCSFLSSHAYRVHGPNEGPSVLESNLGAGGWPSASGCWKVASPGQEPKPVMVCK